MARIDDKLFYSNAIKKHGLTPKGVCWISEDTQYTRFEAICSLLPKDLSSFTLSDAGCGFGDFYHYLLTNKKNVSKYTPIDSLKQMCHITEKNCGITPLHIDLIKTRPPVSDFFVCSGALNILTPYEVVLFIQNCYKSSKKAFIFNTLFGDKKSKTYNYMKKDEIEYIAKSLNVRKVVYKDRYLKNDITVGFFR